MPSPKKKPPLGIRLTWEPGETQAQSLKKMNYWKLQADKVTLRHLDPIYDVFLTDINTKDDFLFWILHLDKKQWMTNEAIAEFITATRYLLEKKIRV